MVPKLSQHWQAIQGTLFPFLEEELGCLTKNHEKLATVLEFVPFGSLLRTIPGGVGRPEEDRRALARAFFAKTIFNLPTTKALIDHLHCDSVMRRMCGWERRSQPVRRPQKNLPKT